MKTKVKSEERHDSDIIVYVSIDGVETTLVGEDEILSKLYEREDENVVFALVSERPILFVSTEASMIYNVFLQFARLYSG
jgi:hypothetical protein